MTARADSPQPEDVTRWQSRPRLAVALRVGIFLAPVVAAASAGLLVGRLIGDRPLWQFLAVVGATCITTSLVVERVVRRFLPLETLLRMTMLFPRRAPSRLAVARLGRDRAELRRLLASPAGAEDVAHVMLALITALGRHDKRTRGHSERVRMITELLADQLQLPQPDRDRLRWAALLHDVGKLEIAAAVLSKPGRLDASEWELMRQHPNHGARLAGPFADWLGEWAGGIVHHHEHWDGKGYPAGLAGEEISRAGRIVAVVDAFETMTAARSYKRAGSTRTALAELARCAGTQFDPTVVRQFLCIPVPRLWWATGPLGLLVQVPVIGSAQQSVLQVSATVSASAGGTVAAAGTAAVVGVGSALGVTVVEPPSSSRDVVLLSTSSDAGDELPAGTPSAPADPSASTDPAGPGTTGAVGDDATSPTAGDDPTIGPGTPPGSRPGTVPATPPVPTQRSGSDPTPADRTPVPAGAPAAPRATEAPAPAPEPAPAPPAGPAPAPTAPPAAPAPAPTTAAPKPDKTKPAPTPPRNGPTQPTRPAPSSTGTPPATTPPAVPPAARAPGSAPSDA